MILSNLQVKDNPPIAILTIDDSDNYTSYTYVIWVDTEKIKSLGLKASNNAEDLENLFNAPVYRIMKIITCPSGTFITFPNGDREGYNYSVSNYDSYTYQIVEGLNIL